MIYVNKRGLKLSLRVAKKQFLTRFHDIGTLIQGVEIEFAPPKMTHIVVNRIKWYHII